MPTDPSVVIDQLVQSGVLSAEQKEQLLTEARENNTPVKSLLLERKLIGKSDWLKAKSDALGIALVDLDPEAIDKELLDLFPENSLRTYQFIPFEKDGNELHVALVDPNNAEAQEAIRFISAREGLKPKLFLMDEDQFKQIFLSSGGLKDEVAEALQELAASDTTAKQQKSDVMIDSFDESVVSEAPISKIVAVILRYATEMKASDIHIEPLDTQIKIRFRVDGVLHTSLILDKGVHQSIVSRIKILSRMKIDETRVPQDGRFHARINNRKIDFRVSTLPTAFGEKVVKRILDPMSGINSLDDLGLFGRNKHVIEEAIQSPFGMILASGPTGSGKTTTLYTILSILNQEGVNIISLEDPVEYFIEGVNQSQVRPEIDYTFASGLRSILRQDPDIIMVGEIRDSETASLATHAALTGHLLLSTLHTNNAIGIIPRLTDMDIQKYLIPTTLLVGVAQRLTRRICQECKEVTDVPVEMLEVAKREFADIPDDQKADIPEATKMQFFKGKGCKACGGTGTKGRIAMYEILKMTPEIEKAMLTGVGEQALEVEAKKQGMTSMKQDGILKALKGLISLEEVLRVVERDI